MNIFAIKLLIITFHFNLYVKQNEQILVDYSFKFIHYTGKYNIKTITDDKTSYQMIFRNFNMQIAPGIIENKTDSVALFKNLSDRKVYFKDIRGEFNVYESLNTMNWNITNNSKDILNYKCYEATTSWRGRDYIAYFTTELPFNLAPWKFHGLPGVLLEIRSVDKKLVLEATQIRISQKAKRNKNPFLGSNLLTWEKYLEKYKTNELKKKKFRNKMSIILGRKIIGAGGPIELLTKNDIQSEIDFDRARDKY